MGGADIERTFARALERLRQGPIGSELQATYATAESTKRVTTFWGDPMDVVLPELAACELDRYGLIEPGVTRVFLDVVTRGAVVFDVGAHLGYFSLLASALGAEVHAFEPSTSTRTLLECNVGDRVKVIAEGVWGEKGVLELKDYGARHSAVNTFIASKDESLGAPERTELVAVTSIDRYAESTGCVPDLIKIDAEGAEVEVLKGARSTIGKRHPTITLEVGDAEGSPRSRAALDLARDLGYTMHDATPAGRRPHVLQESYSYGNVVLM